MTFKEKVVKHSGQRGWKQVDLFREMGKIVSSNTVGRWWNGEKKPFNNAAIVLARTLGTSLDYLADDNLDEDPGPEALPLDARLLLATFKEVGIDVHEAIKRLRGEPAKPLKLKPLPKPDETKEPKKKGSAH